eukprot:6529231-Prymnesium_polylepis.2
MGAPPLSCDPDLVAHMNPHASERPRADQHQAQGCVPVRCGVLEEDRRSEETLAAKGRGGARLVPVTAAELTAVVRTRSSIVR